MDDRKIIDAEYEAHKMDDICPHTTNPLQLKTLCRRCRTLDMLGVSVYQMPQGDWAVSYNCEISDGYSTRQEAENWGISHCHKSIEYHYGQIILHDYINKTNIILGEV